MQAYGRRARVVRPGKEATSWADITADMMSGVGEKYIYDISHCIGQTN